MRVLVSGGTGYLGSHTTLALIDAGHDVVILDNFSNSKRSVLGRIHALSRTEVTHHEFDACDTDRVDALIESGNFDAIVHFAGFKAVGESVSQPLNYYSNNLLSTLALLNSAVRYGVDNFVFSSSSTIYGPSMPLPYQEEFDGAPSPTNPYGWTKAMGEQILFDVANSHSRLKVALLRYFNPVGAHESGLIGEDPRGTPSNLVPFIAQVAIGLRQQVAVYGRDYDTPDGTCLRDYIHVQDLADGHVAALEHLPTMSTHARAFNLGTGKSTSVLEMIQAFEGAVGSPLRYEFVGRRPGDLSASLADPSRAFTELGWAATRSIDAMCADAWRWQLASDKGISAA